ncbi:MAG: hypothetical protein LEGION0398_MBIBDBAK_00771 [Legionellaceae bacterium]
MHEIISQFKLKDVINHYPRLPKARLTGFSKQVYNAKFFKENKSSIIEDIFSVISLFDAEKHLALVQKKYGLTFEDIEKQNNDSRIKEIMNGFSDPQIEYPSIYDKEKTISKFFNLAKILGTAYPKMSIGVILFLVVFPYLMHKVDKELDSNICFYVSILEIIVICVFAKVMYENPSKQDLLQNYSGQINSHINQIAESLLDLEANIQTSNTDNIEDSTAETENSSLRLRR